MTMFPESEGPGSERDHSLDPRECGHDTLVKAQQSGLNDVDTDLSIYTCAACKKSFTITDF